MLRQWPRRDPPQPDQDKEYSHVEPHRKCIVIQIDSTVEQKSMFNRRGYKEARP